MRKKFLKKISAFALAGAMMAGMATNVFAVWNDTSKEYCMMDGVNVTYVLGGNLSGEAEAATIVVSDYDAIEIYASVYVEAYGMYSWGAAETIGSDYEKRIVESGRGSDVVIRLSTPAYVTLIEMSAYSEHTSGFYDGIDVLSHSWELDLLLD